MSIFGKEFTKEDLNRVIWTAVQAFVAVFAAASVTDLNSAKVAATAGVTAGVAALISAIKNLVLDDGSAIK